ncbi:hypothetical protein C0Q70_14577 [Pomacea canaliculata]|uniref:Uncharacterized protein n=1 Tax=Pomacea canaliculata TaxID=400727 RepID=A0A2T7NSF3_POMCA|nr:hypothetical protein C0Q70_14577 [Pomacea canaliculata]
MHNALPRATEEGNEVITSFSNGVDVKQDPGVLYSKSKRLTAHGTVTKNLVKDTRRRRHKQSERKQDKLREFTLNAALYSPLPLPAAAWCKINSSSITAVVDVSQDPGFLPERRSVVAPLHRVTPSIARAITLADSSTDVPLWCAHHSDDVDTRAIPACCSGGEFHSHKHFSSIPSSRHP